MVGHEIAETNTAVEQSISGEELDRLIEVADRAKARACVAVLPARPSPPPVPRPLAQII
jgi:hypothetical protein